jgi:hypothetical protein
MLALKSVGSLVVAWSSQSAQEFYGKLSSRFSAFYAPNLASPPIFK